MRLGPDLRAYGEIRGLSAAAWAALAPDCPFEGAVYADGVLEIEHEGGWVDTAAFLDALGAVLSPDGEGHLDIIDNEAWAITRVVVENGKLRRQSFGIDDVLENTKGEGNI